MYIKDFRGVVDGINYVDPGEYETYKDTKLYWYSNYQIKDFTEELMKNGHVIFDTTEPRTKEEIKQYRLEKDTKKYGNSLIVETPSAIDKIKTLETAQLVKNGQPVPGLVQQQSNIVTSYLNGKEVASTRQYLDKEKILNNKTLRSEYEAHAKGVLTTSLSEQKAYMEQRLGIEVPLKEWQSTTPEDKTKKIVSALESNTIDDLGFGSFVPKAADDADVKFYKEQLGKDIVKGDEIYVKTNEKFSDIDKKGTIPLTQTELNRQRKVEDINYIAKKLKQKDYKFEPKAITKLASSFGVTYGKNIENKDGELYGITLKLGDRELTILDTDKKEQAMEKILRLKVPGLTEKEYTDVVNGLKNTKDKDLPKDGDLISFAEDAGWLKKEKSGKKGDNKLSASRFNTTK